MTENPYSPPASDQNDGTQRSVGFVVMFWLTGLLGIAAIGLGAIMGYQNVRFLFANDMGLVPYVIAANALLFTCGVLMLVSAWYWRSRKLRSGLILTLVSVVAFFAGPPILLSVLAGP